MVLAPVGGAGNGLDWLIACIRLALKASSPPPLITMLLMVPSAAIEKEAISDLPLLLAGTFQCESIMAVT